MYIHVDLYISNIHVWCIMKLGKNTWAHVSLELNTRENFKIFTDTLKIILTNSFPPQDNKIVWFYILQLSHFQNISVLYFLCTYIPVKDMMLYQPFSHVFCILLRFAIHLGSRHVQQSSPRGQLEIFPSGYQYWCRSSELIHGLYQERIQYANVNSRQYSNIHASLLLL